MSNVVCSQQNGIRRTWRDDSENKLGSEDYDFEFSSSHESEFARLLQVIRHPNTAAEPLWRRCRDGQKALRVATMLVGPEDCDSTSEHYTNQSFGLAVAPLQVSLQCTFRT